jgi:hypothetical protein
MPVPRRTYPEKNRDQHHVAATQRNVFEPVKNAFRGSKRFGNLLPGMIGRGGVTCEFASRRD